MNTCTLFRSAIGSKNFVDISTRPISHHFTFKAQPTRISFMQLFTHSYGRNTDFQFMADTGALL
jgi:hypothetical protein